MSIKAADQFGLKSRDRVLQVGIKACLILGFVWVMCSPHVRLLSLTVCLFWSDVLLILIIS